MVDETDLTSAVSRLNQQELTAVHLKSREKMQFFKNDYVREFLAEFLGTFILIVRRADKWFLGSWIHRNRLNGSPFRSSHSLEKLVIGKESGRNGDLLNWKRGGFKKMVQ